MAINTKITQILTPLPAAPQRNDRETFAAKADPFLAVMEGVPTEQNTYATQANTMANEINSTVVEINQIKTDTEQFKYSASSAANYKGVWSSLTGSLSIPASVYHNGKNWQLLQDLADVTSVEPGTNGSYWYDLSIKTLENLSFYDKTIFSADNLEYIARAEISDTFTLLAYYTSSVAGCRAIVVDSSNGIALSNELNFDVAGLGHISACPLSQTQAAICYSGLDNDGYAIVLNYNKDTNILSKACEPFEFLDGVNFSYGDCVALPDSKIGVFYVNSSDNDIYGLVLDWDQSNLSISTAQTSLYTGSVQHIQATVIKSEDATNTANIAISFYVANATRILGVYWSGVALSSVGDSIYDCASNFVATIVSISENSIAVLSKYYQSGFLSYPQLSIYYHGGGPADELKLVSKIPIGTPSNMLNTYLFSIIKSSGNEITVLYEDGDNNIVIQSFDIVVPSETLSEGSVKKITDQNIIRNISSYATLSSIGDDILIAYRDADNSSYGTVEKIKVNL